MFRLMKVTISILFTRRPMSKGNNINNKTIIIIIIKHYFGK